MPRPSRRPAHAPFRWKKALAWLGGTLVVLAIVALFAAKLWLNSYLGSTSFRQMIERKSGQSLRGQVTLTPLVIKGTGFFCPEFKVLGGEEARFSGLTLSNARGEMDLSLSKLLNQDWRISNVDIQRADLDFTGGRLQLDLPPFEKSERFDRVDMVTVRDTNVLWPGGNLKGAVLETRPIEGGWSYSAHGGQVECLGLPQLDIATLRLNHRGDTFSIQEAELRQGSGSLTGTGEIVSGGPADVQLQLKNVNITPLLPEDWRARFHGFLNGESRVRFSLAKDAALPVITGKLQLTQGVLEALPVLTRIADFTKMDQFRRITITRASFDFRHDAGGLNVTNLILESDRLIAIRGGFTVINGQLDGTFEVGVTAKSLEWLPGSQEHVFTTPRDGYSWTTMHLTGPANAPQEDLSGRLVSAAGDAAIDKVGETAVDVTNKVIESGLNLLFGK